MKRTEIKTLLRTPPEDGAVVTVCGWAKTVRDSKNIGFIELSDGSGFKPLQIVFESSKLDNYKDIAKCGVGTSLCVTGRVVLEAAARGQRRLHRRAGRVRAGVSASEKTPHRGIFAHDAASARAHEHVLGGVPRAQRRGVRHP